MLLQIASCLAVLVTTGLLCCRLIILRVWSKAFSGFVCPEIAHLEATILALGLPTIIPIRPTTAFGTAISVVILEDAELEHFIPILLTWKLTELSHKHSLWLAPHPPLLEHSYSLWCGACGLDTHYFQSQQHWYNQNISFYGHYLFYIVVMDTYYVMNWRFIFLKNSCVEILTFQCAGIRKWRLWSD